MGDMKAQWISVQGSLVEFIDRDARKVVGLAVGLRGIVGAVLAFVRRCPGKYMVPGVVAARIRSAIVDRTLRIAEGWAGLGLRHPGEKQKQREKQNSRQRITFHGCLPLFASALSAAMSDASTPHCMVSVSQQASPDLQDGRFSWLAARYARTAGFAAITVGANSTLG